MKIKSLIHDLEIPLYKIDQDAIDDELRERWEKYGPKHHEPGTIRCVPVAGAGGGTVLHPDDRDAKLTWGKKYRRRK